VHPPHFTDRARRCAAALLAAALQEDLNERGDLTTHAVISPEQRGRVQIVARRAGVLAGLPTTRMVFDAVDPDLELALHAADGDRLTAGECVATLSGRMESLLIGERTALNFLTHLSGIATLTRRFVDAVAGTGVQILDTRKTLPGWRGLQKYAVTCGGGSNHRIGLFDGVLLKDNHLAAWRQQSGQPSIAAAVQQARRRSPADSPIEVEVDSLGQLRDALAGAPDIVLLDNMPPSMLRDAVDLRNRLAPGVRLEASGGVTLDTVRSIAESGVDRISIGALTHSAPALDLAFDWAPPEQAPADAR
jgi:nicotinate-nucleotide pyrophosphorylase (carboxylating)